MKKEIILPEHIGEITLGQYQEYYKLTQRKDLSDVNFNRRKIGKKGKKKSQEEEEAERALREEEERRALAEEQERLVRDCLSVVLCDEGGVNV